ncbi:MAG: DEAD/DEAH box helicase family protein [Patescibacteria group bacterium]
MRNPQIGALCSIISHNSISDSVATVVMPTGTGKTEVMLASLIALRQKTILVVVPTDALREQIANKFLGL